MQANVDFARANPAAIVSLLRAEIHAQRFLADPANKAQAIAALTAGKAVSADDAVLCYEEMVERDAVFSNDAAIGPENLSDLIAGLRRLGESDCPREARDYLDLTWLDEARRQL
jgi:ABC-type nitrate/sulfonate/bicarbonate transport system substrate-binding protein